jgi:hypothetical protein
MFAGVYGSHRERVQRPLPCILTPSTVFDHARERQRPICCDSHFKYLEISALNPVTYPDNTYTKAYVTHLQSCADLLVRRNYIAICTPGNR